MVVEWDVDPEIFNLFGSVSVRYYSLLFMGGLLIGIEIVRRIWIKEGLSKEAFDKLTLYIFLATIIGARLGHCLFYEPSYYLAHPLEMILPISYVDGELTFTGFLGLASHGGILAVFLTTLFFTKRNQLSFLSIIDKVAIGGAIAGSFIRLGNLMNSEIIGKPTNADFGFVFKRVDDIVRHPSQLYEAIAYFFIFLIILYIYRNKKNMKEGFVLGVFFTLLFGARFLIEFTKIDQVGFEEGMLLNMGQILSIPFFIIGLSFTIYKSNIRLSTSVNN